MEENQNEEKFLASVRDLASSQHSISSIADALEFRGEQRLRFFEDAMNPKSPVSLAYLEGRKAGMQDENDAMHALAASGDSAAAELVWKKNHDEEVRDLRMKLFGI